MRIAYRSHAGNKSYWEKRWSKLSVDQNFLDPSVYPGRYAHIFLNKKFPNGPILEAGCGLGRILRFCLRQSVTVIGFDFIYPALKKILKVEPLADLCCGDVEALPFEDSSFGGVIAFGLYHNLEFGFDGALKETTRVMKSGGILCASFRIDSLHNKIIDKFMGSRGNIAKGEFHKINYTLEEIFEVFRKSSLEVSEYFMATNMPLSYRIRCLRYDNKNDVADEEFGRAGGYRLSLLGKILEGAFQFFFPIQSANLIVVFAKKVKDEGD